MAIAWLMKKKEGEARDALHHHTIGDISIVWGDDKTGLAKIINKHPEVVKRKGAGSETSLPAEEGNGKSGRGGDVNIDSGEFTPTQGEVRQQKGSGIGNISSREAALRDVVVDRLKKSGVDVVTDVEEAQRLLDEANGERLSQDKKRALETVSSSRDERYQQTVVSSADGAKVLNNLDKLVSDYEENEKTHEKTFVGTVANALGAKSHNSKSEYATFETKNGRVVTIRLADWINKGYATYINKEKALDYLRISAPIAEAQDNQELVSAAKVVENFKNPEVLGKNVSKADGKDEPLYRTSAEIDAEYPNWLNGTTTESGKHSTQVAGTVGTYRKVGEWIKKNLGLGALTRGNPEAHGYLLSV